MIKNNIENEIDDMIPIIFNNKTENPINMSLIGIEDIYDLFCFCIDLFIKGLIFLYGDHDNKINLDEITQDMLDFTIDQLSKAGIKVTIDVDQNNSNVQARITIPEKNASITRLDDYRLEIHKSTRLYKISFNLERYL